MLSITVLATLLSAALSLPLEPRQASTANELLNGPCKKVTVIYARGTTEPGNIGTDVGPQLSAAVKSRLGSDNVAFQGVDYPADIGGYLIGGSPSGATTLASLVNTAVTKCPSTQIVLSGYSQGAQVVYKGAAKLSSSQAAKVNAAVLFGNPNNGKPVPNINNANVLTYCNNGDLICAGEPIVLPPHLDYAKYAGAAADYIATKVSV